MVKLLAMAHVVMGVWAAALLAAVWPERMPATTEYAPWTAGVSSACPPPRFFLFRGGKRTARQAVPVLRSPAKRTKKSSDSGLASEPGLAAFSSGTPDNIFFTGTSSFLPVSVMGISGMA